MFWRAGTCSRQSSWWFWRWLKMFSTRNFRIDRCDSPRLGAVLWDSFRDVGNPRIPHGTRVVDILLNSIRILEVLLMILGDSLKSAARIFDRGALMFQDEDSWSGILDSKRFGDARDLFFFCVWDFLMFPSVLYGRHSLPNAMKMLSLLPLPLRDKILWDS